MRFEMRLEVPQALHTTAVDSREYDDELDDIGSVLHDVCQALEQGGVQFDVQICTDAPWPVTVRTDLAVIAEQLSAALTSLAEDIPARLEFYEQGVERVVALMPSGDSIVVECSDLVPKPSSFPVSVTLDRRAVLEELCLLASTFITAAKLAAGELATHPWFVAFVNDLSQSIERAQCSR